MGLHSNNVQGSASVSRNANVGGNATVRGCLTIGHHLTVKGWLDVPNIKGPLKGLYASEATLNAAYPRPMPGWFALVGNTLPAAVYRAEGGKWTATGETGGGFALYPEQLEADVSGLREELKDTQGNLETATETLQGALDTASATLQTAAEKEASDRKAADAALQGLLEAEKSAREASDDALKGRFDALVGENASEAIDNFSEVLAFLDGLTDTEKLSSKLAGLGTGLSNEQKAREAAVTGLSESLTEEETAREAGDKALADSIALERLRTLALEQAVWPLDVTFSVAPSTIEAGKATEASASWSAKRAGKDILAAATVTLLAGTETLATEAGASRVKKTLSPTAPGDTTFRLTVGYEGMTREASATVKAVHPSYFGKVAADGTVTAAAVTALTKVLNPSKAMTQSGLSLANQRLCYAYPKSFGTLSSVKDGNNFETLTAYIRTEVTVGEVAYYVYAMTTPVTATGVKQTYS